MGLLPLGYFHIYSRLVPVVCARRCEILGYSVRMAGSGLEVSESHRSSQVYFLEVIRGAHPPSHCWKKFLFLIFDSNLWIDSFLISSGSVLHSSRCLIICIHSFILGCCLCEGKTRSAFLRCSLTSYFVCSIFGVYSYQTYCLTRIVVFPKRSGTHLYLSSPEMTGFFGLF